MSITQQIMSNPGKYSIQQLQHAMDIGTIPAYIAIPLIQQKAQEAKMAQMSATGQQALPQNAPTVAEQVMQEAAPSGIGALPTNLPAKGYAPGGIIAFDNGGYVDEYGSMYSVPDVTGYETPLTPPAGIRKFFQTLNPFESEESKALRAKQDKRMYVPPPGYDKNGRPVTPTTAQIEQKKATSAPAAPLPPPSQMPPATSKTPASGEPSYKAPSVSGISGITNPYTKSVVDELKKQLNPIYLDESKYIPKELTSGEAAQNVRDMQAAFGVSDKPYNEQMERLKKRGEILEAQRGRSKWDALAMAGFSMAAGKSPYFLQNVAEGGIKGLQNYKEAQEKLNESQERLDAANFAVADAQNRFRMEGSKEAATDLRENKRDVAAAKRDVAKDSVAAQRAAKTAQTNIDVNALNTGMEVAYKNADLQLRKVGLNIQSFSAETQRKMLEKPDLINTTLGFLNQDPKFTNASGTDKARMFTDAVSMAHRTATGSQGFGLRKAYEEDFKIGGGQYNEYKRIEKAKGRDAAEKFREDYINRKMRAAGVMGNVMESSAGAELVYDPASGTLKPASQ